MKDAGATAQILWSRAACRSASFACKCISGPGADRTASSASSTQEKLPKRAALNLGVPKNLGKTAQENPRKRILSNDSYGHRHSRNPSSERSAEIWENSSNSPSSDESLTEGQRESILREAIGNQNTYNKKRKKQWREKVDTFEKGDIIGVSVSKNDRTKLDCSILWGIVVAIKENASSERMYRIQTAKCLLKGWFAGSALRKTLIDYEELHELDPPTSAQIRNSSSGKSLSAAVQLHTGCKTMGAQHCLCQTFCKTRRCKCRKGKQKCNTSRACMKKGSVA